MLGKSVRSLGFKTRILIVALALFLFGIWGLAGRTAAVMQADIEKLLTDQMTATVGYAAADIDRKIQLRIDMLKELAESITPDILSDPIKLQRHLEQRSTFKALFPTGVFVANRQGRNIAEYPPLEGRLGGFVGDFAYFQEVIAKGQIAISKPLLGRFSKQAVVTVGVPLTDTSHATAGVLVGPFSGAVSTQSLCYPIRD